MAAPPPTPRASLMRCITMKAWEKVVDFVFDWKMLLLTVGVVWLLWTWHRAAERRVGLISSRARAWLSGVSDPKLSTLHKWRCALASPRGHQR
jgi:hypothetical protein